MGSAIRSPKDFWSGIMFLAFGLGAIYIARDYAMGTAGRMGPAYFPTMLGWLLALIGSGAVIRSFIKPGEAIAKFAFKPLCLVLVSVLLFAFLIRGAGMVVAIPVLILVSAFASRYFNWKVAALLAIGATIFCVMLFVKALGLPMPVIGSWFGG